MLDEILKKKHERLKRAKSTISVRELKAGIPGTEKPRDFKGAVRRQRTPAGGQQAPVIKLIAEIKKASPSKGVIREDFEPLKIAQVYQEKADAISVLTEEDFFQGDLRYIKDIKDVTDRPVLRKDFIFDEYQIYESRAAGADAILLIETVLDRVQADEYCRMAEELGMSVLFEVHDLKGLEKALTVDAPIIGINNRNLKTLKIDLNTTFEIKKEIPEGKTVVSESGIKTKDDILKIKAAGVDAVLIGTAFMNAGDISKKIDELMGGHRPL